MKILVWFRNDLRIKDNLALTAAAKVGEILPLYIWAPQEEGEWPPGGGSQAWLYHSLESLNTSLEGNLILKKGDPLSLIQEVMHESGAAALFFNRRYEPTSIQKDLHRISTLQQAGFDVQTFNSSLLVQPWEVVNKEGKPFRVFTPFWKIARKLAFDSPLEEPALRFATYRGKSLTVDQLGLKKRSLQMWEIGEKGAQKRLKTFLKRGLETYDTLRDRPDVEGVSRLSPHLHFGEIGPKQIAHAVQKTGMGEGYVRELYWREFSYYILYHFPYTTEEPMYEKFRAFPWEEAPENLRAWQVGKTGYPFVDAGMRQLQTMGWIHNRVRMVVASFLTKHLLIPWQAGARWFWEYLVDADLASNTMGWQWTAGCGADAAPYFRIFNPISQGEKFDPDGTYIRTFVPELREVDTKWIHRPWEAPHPPSDYPLPIIDHSVARERALKSFEKVKV